MPAFSGLGAPYFDRGATGLLAGITGGTTGADLARAAFDAVAHQVCDVVEAMESDGAAHLGVLHADGGATASALLMQIQADLLGRPVHVSGEPEASALGAAMLAAQGLGHTWPRAEVDASSSPSQPQRVVTPAIDDDERRARREAWRTAVARSRGTPVPTRPADAPAPPVPAPPVPAPPLGAPTSSDEAAPERRRTP
nr:FGGY-family carbohydrate kinase [Litorihabitans aurantiacus]